MKKFPPTTGPTFFEKLLALFWRRKPSLEGPLKGKWVRRVVYHRAPE